MSVKESLARFGTFAFDGFIMKNLIEFEHSYKEIGVLRLTVWFAVVPDIYKNEVRKIVEDVSEDYLNRPMTEELLDGFIARVEGKIWSDVEPKPVRAFYV